MSLPASPDSAYLERLDGISYLPVFILGDHRSGTTLLYRLMTASDRFTPITAYHVIHADRLLSDHEAGRGAGARSELAERFRAAGLADRVLDGVPVSPDLPEEYGFVLGGPRPRLTSANMSTFDTLCRKVRATAETARPLLVKNPWDIANAVFISSHFPTARFVFIHRDPVDLVNSQVRAVRSMFASRNPYIAFLAPWYARLCASPIRLAVVRWFLASPSGPGLSIACRHVVRTAHTVMREARAMNLEKRIDVTYEALCRDPDAVMGRILQFLDAAPSETSFSGFIQQRSRRMLPEVETRGAALYRKLRAYCERFEIGSNKREGISS